MIPIVVSHQTSLPQRMLPADRDLWLLTSSIVATGYEAAVGLKPTGEAEGKE